MQACEWACGHMSETGSWRNRFFHQAPRHRESFCTGLEQQGESKPISNHIPERKSKTIDDFGKCMFSSTSLALRSINAVCLLGHGQ